MLLAVTRHYMALPTNSTAAPGTGHVLDYKTLAQGFGQLVAYRPRQNVGAATGRERHHDAHGFAGVGLGPSDRATGQHQEAKKCNSAFHLVISFCIHNSFKVPPSRLWPPSAGARQGLARPCHGSCKRCPQDPIRTAPCKPLPPPGKYLPQRGDCHRAHRAHRSNAHPACACKTLQMSTRPGSPSRQSGVPSH